MWDLFTREIPNSFPLALLAWAVASRLIGFQEQDWASVGLGLATGLSIGLALFALGWMGAGDGKLLAALGACIGSLGLLATLPYIALVGGVWAFVAIRRGQKEVVYGPAIAIGYLVAIAV